MKLQTTVFTLIWLAFINSISVYGQLPAGWDYQVTISTHIISIPLTSNPNIQGVPLSPGDYIGVFFTNDEGRLACGGASQWTGIQNTGIISFGDDPYSSVKDGFASGEIMTYKIHSYVYNTDFFAEAVCDEALPTTCEFFVSNGLSGITSLQTINNFSPVWLTPFNPMTIRVMSAILDENNLQAGDEIGVFDIAPDNGEEICVGIALLQDELTNGISLEITASMNDETGGRTGNGFTQGHEMMFKYFSQTVGLIENIDISFPISGYDEVFTPGGSAFVSLIGNIPENHNIELPTGWSGISSFVTPASAAIVDITSGILDELVIIKNNEGFYQPGNPLSNLSQWNYQSGYFVKVTENTNLTITGNQPSNTTIELSTGWNLIAVLCNLPVSIEDVFADNLQHLVAVKDAIGINIYWPEKNIFTLQHLEPGKAYMVRVTDNFTISFETFY